jgi:hypothetical protein
MPNLGRFSAVRRGAGLHRPGNNKINCLKNQTGKICEAFEAITRTRRAESAPAGLPLVCRL